MLSTRNELVLSEVSSNRTRSFISPRTVTWSINWFLLLDEEKSDPKNLLNVLNSQTLNDQELFQAVMRRDWETALRFTKRLKIKVTAIHANSAAKKATQLEEALQRFQKEDEEFLKTKFYKQKEKLLSREIVISKIFIELVEELRDMIAEIEEFLEEPFNAGNCSTYVKEVQRSFIDQEEPPKEATCLSYCKIF